MECATSRFGKRLRTDEYRRNGWYGLTQAAYQEMLAKQGAYALDPMHPSSTNNLDTAGRVAALTDRGLQLGIQDGYDDQARQAAEIYARKNNAYGAMMSLGTFGIGNLPGGDLMNA